MPSFLVFRLYAPLASWGAPAVGEQRPTAPYPSRSAVLGLVAGALGLVRGHPRQADLRRSYGFAWRLDGSSKLLVDYHTTQVAEAVALKKHDPTSRYEAMILAGSRIATVLSSREYLQDHQARIALWSRTPEPR